MIAVPDCTTAIHATSMRPRSQPAAATALVLGVGLAATVTATATALSPPADTPPLAARLADTGLYAAGPANAIDPGHQSYTPQYALWSDGAEKRRWFRLPTGTHIDAADPDTWEFPPGTRFWKEFSYGDRRVETRLIERLADGGWRFVAYVWNEDGTDAVLVPARGIAALPVAEAPDGRYTIPSRDDCRACHEGRVPVLGVTALQLSPDRDPLAPHATPPRPGDADLHSLVEKGWLANLPPELLARPPRIQAASASERAVLGYLHANCGHCHNRSVSDDPTVPVDLSLARQVGAGRDDTRALQVLLDTPLRYRMNGVATDMRLIAPGDIEASVLVHRMRSRNPMSRMPPLGTRHPDTEALALIERWIHDLQVSPGANP